MVYTKIKLYNFACLLFNIIVDRADRSRSTGTNKIYFRFVVKILYKCLIFINITPI